MLGDTFASCTHTFLCEEITKAWRCTPHLFSTNKRFLRGFFLLLLFSVCVSFFGSLLIRSPYHSMLEGSNDLFNHPVHSNGPLKMENGMVYRTKRLFSESNEPVPVKDFFCFFVFNKWKKITRRKFANIAVFVGVFGSFSPYSLQWHRRRHWPRGISPAIQISPHR